MGLTTLEKIIEVVKSGKSVAMVTIIKSSGSTPRKSGTLMGVYLDGIIGTIGGGAVELEVIKRAKRAILENRDDYFTYDLNATGELKMSCGGKVEGYIKIINPLPRIVILGAGHIGVALYKIIDGDRFEKIIFDDREENIDVEYVAVGEYKDCIEKLPDLENTYYVIVTKSHEDDEKALEAVLKKKHKYIGMIGSQKKVLEIRERVEKKGLKIDESTFYSPIGLRVSDGTPYEIAVEILAEILKVKNDGKLEHRRLIINKKGD